MMGGNIFAKLVDEAQKIWCYRRLWAIVTVIAIAIGIPVTWKLPNVYESWGQLHIQKHLPLSAAIQGVTLNGSDASSNVLNPKTLLTDDNLTAVIHELNIGQPPPGPLELAKQIATLRLTVKTTPVDEDGFLEIDSKSTDAAKAPKIVEAMMNQYIKLSLGGGRSDLSQAGKFLDQQITSYQQLVIASQHDLTDFLAKHPGADNRGGGLAVDNGNGGDVFLTENDTQASVAESQVAQAPRAPSAEDQKIADLEARLSNLKLQYTDEYPDVIATKKQLSGLLEKRSQTGGASASASSATAATPSAAPRRILRRARGGGRRSTAISAEVASQWADLQAKDEMLRANYQQLLSRRQATTMSEAVSGADLGGRFDITHKPTAPAPQTSPPKAIMFAVVVLLSVLLGLGVAYLRALRTGVFVSPKSLEEEFQLPVAGTVSWEPAWQTAGNGKNYGHQRLMNSSALHLASPEERA